jgi:N-6 DNA Methylase
MQLDLILASLGYDQSANYLQGKALETDRDFGHVFRKAQSECNLHGAYVLNGTTFEKSRGSVPTVFVCQASTEQEAREIHRKVWNQNAVPFLLVISTGWVRLYPGFQYDRDVTEHPLAGALRVLHDFHDVTSQLGPIQASEIDNGGIWSELGRSVTPDSRVDWQLLDNLNTLDRWLEQDGVADRRLAHAMIGKFVYLQYLRQRDILSDNRLSGWGIDPSVVFGHNADIVTFIELVNHVDEWLNGSVFPLSQQRIREFGAERLRKVASVFRGADAVSGQLPLFDVYDFSFIPIETLSVIYEQFLHAIIDPSGASEGHARGAYYTPVPLVNYMLDRLDTRQPLKLGMRVLDASCGLGAFLVQCYRKLVERRRQELGRRLRPTELGALLRNHVFGVDLDEDACQIAELSLVLTLLDYIDPPDLTETNWQLPALRDRNIFCANAFNDDEAWFKMAQKHPFQWIVGNPPWKELNPRELVEDDKPAWDWMINNKDEYPVGGNQLAEAFAWRCAQFMDEHGVSALLLPAMTLFKYESTSFRRSYMAKHELWSVANFANLADILFAGRATLPAAALFSAAAPPSSEHVIETFSPLVANQLTNAPRRGNRRQDVWSIIVNSSDLAFIESRDVRGGSPLPWKIAMWGTATDLRVLRSTAKRYGTLNNLEIAGAITMSQGPEFIPAEKATQENSVRRDDLIGRDTVDVKSLKNRKGLFAFPPATIQQIKPGGGFVSKRAGVMKKLSVCEPPHVVVGASRNFAVYTEQFLIVPSRQIGINSPTGNRSLLRALALYLNSDFVAYHQFLTTTQAGIQKSISTLAALRGLPLPFTASSDLTAWDTLYRKIVDQCADRDDFNVPELIQELNDLTFESLKLSARGRAAVHDLVQVRFGLTRGKRSPSAVRRPTRDECAAYARMLRDELDGFLNGSAGTRHHVQVLAGDGSGLVAIEIAAGDKPVRIAILDASSGQAKIMEDVRAHLIQERAQWLYFDRNLRVYDGPRTYLLKAFRRLHWTVTQAMADARDIIADSLTTENSPPAGASIV